MSDEKNILENFPVKKSTDKPRGKPKDTRHRHEYMENLLGPDEVNKRFAEAYARTGSARESSELVFGNSVVRHMDKGFRMLKKPEVQKLLRQTLEAKAATPMKAAELIADATEATKLVGKNETEVVDHQTRLRAADMILKAWDAWPGKSGGWGNSGESKHLHIYMQEPLGVQKFILRNHRMPTDEERKQLAGEPSE